MIVVNSLWNVLNGPRGLPDGQAFARISSLSQPEFKKKSDIYHNRCKFCHNYSNQYYYVIRNRRVNLAVASTCTYIAKFQRVKHF
jgi:hypothetical protein